jgi:hypothetical protein
VFVAHPVAGDVRANLIEAARCVRWVALEHPEVVPVAPYLTLCAALDERVPEERQLGMRIGQAVLARCGYMWLFGSWVSGGMAEDIWLAHRFNVETRDFTGERMPELPPLPAARR